VLERWVFHALATRSSRPFILSHARIPQQCWGMFFQASHESSEAKTPPYPDGLGSSVAKPLHTDRSHSHSWIQGHLAAHWGCITFMAIFFPEAETRLWPTSQRRISQVADSFCVFLLIIGMFLAKAA